MSDIVSYNPSYSSVQTESYKYPTIQEFMGFSEAFGHSTT